MNFGEEARHGKTSISSKSVCHATRSCHDARCCEKKADEREDQQTDGTSFTAGRGVEDLEKRASGRGNDIVDVSCNKEQDHQEDETCEDSDTDTCDHDFWTFDRGIGDLFDH
jgi:hypothetical protein